MPVYYYLKKAGLDQANTVEMLNNVVSRSTSKTKLIERLTKGSTQQVPLPSGKTNAATNKRKWAGNLRLEKVNKAITGKDLEYCLQAIRGLSVEEVRSHSKYLRELLKTWFNQHYALAKGPLADNLRRAICWVDEALYMEVGK